MKLVPRLVIVLVVVLAAFAAQSGLMAHLQRSSSVTPGRLSCALSELPLKIGDWDGQDQEIEENLRYGDDHLQRLYRNRLTGQQLAVWMIYSSEAKDRDHHPEVCMKARGLPEDTTARKQISVPGHDQPVQQYRYGHTESQQLVYYWHYRLPSLNAENLDALQRFYHHSRHMPASLTIEIFAPQRTAEEEQGAAQFMRDWDAVLQPVVGAQAVRGSDRKPVLLIQTEETTNPAHH